MDDNKDYLVYVKTAEHDPYFAIEGDGTTILRGEAIDKLVGVPALVGEMRRQCIPEGADAADTYCHVGIDLEHAPTTGEN